MQAKHDHLNRRCAVKMKILSIFTLALVGASAAEEYFKITVIDDKTGRGVPLVELRTTNQLRYYTDSNEGVPVVVAG